MQKISKYQKTDMCFFSVPKGLFFEIKKEEEIR